MIPTTIMPGETHHPQSEGPRLRDLGEDEILRRLTATLHLDPTQVELGAGDDCAILPLPADPVQTRLLLKTDAVVEGTHFHWNMGPARIGRKAVARVLSDFAAMGGHPQALLITLGAPPDLEFALLEGLYQGINATAREFHCSIAGGELTSIAGPVWISIAGVATVPATSATQRSGGQPGDHLYVTGWLGGSFTSGRHLDFTPRLAQGQWLAQNFPPHAMMDLSDGLGADLPRLATASHCGYHLEVKRLPLHANCTPDQALHDGEDYELLLAISPMDAPRLESAWSQSFPNLPLTQIGHLTDPTSHEHEQHQPGGYQHFRGT